MKTKFLELWGYLRVTVGIPLMILIAVTSCFFVYSTVRDWHTRRIIKQQNERIDRMDSQSQEFIRSANESLSKADKISVATAQLIKVVEQMSGNIKQLADADQTVMVKVNSQKNDYENTRNQKRDSVNPAKSLPIGKREDNVLRADRELYPD